MFKNRVFLLLGCLCVLPRIAYSFNYLDVSIGQSNVSSSASVSSLNWFAYTNINTESLDNQDTSYSVCVGYNLGKSANTALEFGWINFGTNTLNASGQDFLPGGIGTRTGKLVSNREAVTTSLVSKKKITNKFSMIGKIGIDYWALSENLTGTVYESGVQTGSINQPLWDSGFGMHFGIGIDYNHIIFRVERYIFGSSTINNVSLGYQF